MPRWECWSRCAKDRAPRTSTRCYRYWQAGELDESWCLVTDDIFPNDLRHSGHLNGLLRRLVVRRRRARRRGTTRLLRARPTLRAGRSRRRLRRRTAPIWSWSRTWNVSASHIVIKDGRLAAREGRAWCTTAPRPRLMQIRYTCPHSTEQSFRLSLLSERLPGDRDRPRPDRHPAQRAQRAAGSKAAGRLTRSATSCLIASIERHRASGRIGLGLVSGFGLLHPGALGSSVAHDSHNLIIAGTNRRRHAHCARVLAEHGGGFVAVAGGAVCQAILPLPVAGLLSLEGADHGCRQLDEVNHAARALGCPLDAPFGTLSFLALPVIPELRITTQGVFDVLGKSSSRCRSVKLSA